VRRCARGFSIAVAVCGVAGAASAAPLAPEICNNLKAEIAAMEQDGIRAAMARGPEVAKATLTPTQLGNIRRLIDADAQVKFRCPANQSASLLKDVAAEDNPDAPGYSSETEVGAVPAKPGAAKAPVAKAAKPKAAAPVPDTETAKSAAKPKPAAKSDDAYRPPASGDANSTPLQQQVPVAKAAKPAS
jgi:hypothetical protein